VNALKLPFPKEGGQSKQKHHLGFGGTSQKNLTEREGKSGSPRGGGKDWRGGKLGREKVDVVTRDHPAQYLISTWDLLKKRLGKKGNWGILNQTKRFNPGGKRGEEGNDVKSM